MGDGEGCGGSPVAVSSTVIGGGGSDLERRRLLMTAMLVSKSSSMFDVTILSVSRSQKVVAVQKMQTVQCNCNVGKQQTKGQGNGYALILPDPSRYVY